MHAEFLMMPCVLVAAVAELQGMHIGLLCCAPAGNPKTSYGEQLTLHGSCTRYILPFVYLHIYSFFDILTWLAVTAADPVVAVDFGHTGIIISFLVTAAVRLT
jgi:hypothetical protein